MFGHSKEIKDLYTAYSEKVQLQEDKKDKKEKGIGLEGSINVPGLGKTIETRKNNNKKEDKKDKKEKGIGLEGSINVPGLGKTIETRNKNIKSELTDKDKDDDKKEKELEFVVNKSKKGDYKKIESDSKSKSDKSNNTFLSFSGSKDSKDDDKVGGSTTSGTKEQQAHHQQKVIDQFKKEQAAKKQKEASDDEKGANEWGPGGQPSASKQIDAYKKGRPSPASFKTNQRQTRELIKKQSKEVYPSVTKQDLNQFNRTKKYTADDGSQVERSTVFTKHYKTGKPLGVMTGSQRKAYDKAAAAHKAGTTTKPVETKPDTYKTKIGAFLNNKKVGDVKNKSKHTKVTSVMDMESYDAKGDDSLNERMAIGGANPNERLGQIARDAIAKTKVGGFVDKVLQSKSKTYKKAREADKKISANAKDQNWKRTDTGFETDAIETSGKDRGKITRGELRNSEIEAGPEAAVSAPAKKKKTTSYEMSSESYDAYDLVLDYIMESKQASSIEEANYIMMEMDQNTIHEIVQAQKKSLDEGVKTAIGLGLLATPYIMSQIEKRWNPVKNKRKEYQNKKATEYEKKSGTTKEDGYFR